MIVALTLGLVGCSGGSEDEETSDGSTSDGSTSSTTGDSTGTSTSTGGCVPGQVDCECLDGSCVGALQCIEGTCQPGPEFEDIPEGVSVLAGLRVPLEVELLADEFSWSQVSGPTADLQGADTTSILVDIPPTAAPGDVVLLRITAVRNTIEDSRDVPIEIHDAVFEDALPDATTMQLGTSEGLDFEGNNMWVVSTEGFVSRFDGDGVFQNSFDLAGQPVGARVGELEMGEDNFVDVLYVANAGNQAVQWMDLGSGSTTVVTDQLEGGEPLGAVNFVLPDDNGDVFFTNRDGQQVLMYDASEGLTHVLATDIGLNPNALAFGPDAGFLYVGTAGKVWRVPVLQDGMIGDVELYLDIGSDADITYEVDGIEFDEGGNMWVGAPNASTLYVARYNAGGATEVINTWSDVGGGVSRFVNVRFGSNAFGRDNLYYTNLGDMTVGRLWVGLERL
jgi:hypothetical protein